MKKFYELLEKQNRRKDKENMKQSRKEKNEKLTNRMWFGVVCTLINDYFRHHSGQNVVESTTNFDHCDDEYHCR